MSDLKSLLDITERLRLREKWRKEAVRFLFSDMKTDRDKLLLAIDIATDEYEEAERGRSVSILRNGDKHLFHPDGTIKTSCTGGRRYGPDGER